MSVVLLQYFFARVDSFLHAYERLGVIEEQLTRSWRRRIAFAFLFPHEV